MALHHHSRSILSYLGITSVFVGALTLGMRRRASRRGANLRAGDMLLYGIATHKLTNILAEDRVTKGIRAPFVEERGEDEEPTGGALRRALGELVTCPYCLGPWVALGLGTTHTFSPRAARFASGVFASVAVSDFLHHGNDLLKARVNIERQMQEIQADQLPPH